MIPQFLTKWRDFKKKMKVFAAREHLRKAQKKQPDSFFH